MFFFSVLLMPQQTDTYHLHHLDFFCLLIDSSQWEAQTGGLYPLPHLAMALSVAAVTSVR